MEFQIPFSLLGMQLGLTRHLWRANRLSDCTVQSSTVLVSVGQCCQKFSARRGQISLCNLHLTCYSFHVTASATSAISLPLPTLINTHMRTISHVQNLRSLVSCLRHYSIATLHVDSNSSRSTPTKEDLTLEEQKERDARFRKRKTEWKRRQGVRRAPTQCTILT